MRITDALQQNMVTWRRALHSMPEIGNELPRTSTYVQSVLTELGIPFKTLMDGNAIVALLEGDRPGKVLALRADMDALRIAEQTGLPFAATNGCMHACGHDGHAAMLLGAAAYLKEHRDFAGTVKLFFQPGEESPGGARPMIEQGAMEDPRVDAVFGIHEGLLNEEAPAGVINFRKGAMMAAADRFLVKVNGFGGHGAYPETVKDPIVMAAEMVQTMQKVVSREVMATDPVVLSVCRISGGTSHNIIPSQVELEGTFRTFNEDTRRLVGRRIEQICQSIATLHGGTAEVLIDWLYPALINDDDFTDFAAQCARTVFGEERVWWLRHPVMGGEDMAYFLQKAPGTYAFMNNPGKIDGQYYPHHHAKFDVDEQYFRCGAELFIEVVRQYLK